VHRHRARATARAAALSAVSVALAAIAERVETAGSIPGPLALVTAWLAVTVVLRGGGSGLLVGSRLVTALGLSQLGLHAYFGLAAQDVHAHGNGHATVSMLVTHLGATGAAAFVAKHGENLLAGLWALLAPSVVRAARLSLPVLLSARARPQDAPLPRPLTLVGGPSRRGPPALTHA
jgi:hypothetical protein